MKRHLHYYPIVKGKEGEFKALQECPLEVKNTCTPIIELLEYHPRPIPKEKLEKRKKPLRTFEDHFKDNVNDIIKSWKDVNKPIFIDTHLIADKYLFDGGQNLLRFMYEKFDEEGIQAIPVIFSAYSSKRNREYRRIARLYDRGICLRVTQDDLNSDTWDSDIMQTPANFNLEPEEIDLVIDNGHIDKSAVTNGIRSTVSTINTLPDVDRWRSLILVSASFPMDLSLFTADSVTKIERSDWKLWNGVLRRTLSRIPAYGDYVIAHPEIRDLGTAIPNMSASFRYTTNDEWIIMKGKGVKKNGFGQTHGLATKLVAMTEYDGEHFSPGDSWLKKCSRRLVGPGSPTTWRQVGSNHHIHKVVSQLSMLSAA